MIRHGGERMCRNLERLWREKWFLAWTPTYTGSRSGVIQISDDVPGSPQTIPLTGPVVQATATVTPTNGMTFAAQLVGTTSVGQNVTITNSGSRASVTPSTDFRLGNNCKAGIAAGARGKK